MRTQMMGLALAATALTVVAGCSSSGTGGTTDTAADKVGSGLGSAAGGPSVAATAASGATTGTTTKKNNSPTKATTKPWTSTTTAAAAGPEIVYFTIAQKPRCAEGTNVYQNPAVPLIIKWKISHASSGALSVDDPTHTPGTYGPVGLTGSQDFSFSCAGTVGTTETHTYAIYSVGGGTQRSKSLTVSTKVLDKGTVVN